MADKKETYPFSISLNIPIELGDKSIEEIRYREPIGRDMHEIIIKSSGEITLGSMAKLFGKICDQPPQVIDLLKPIDYMRVVQLSTDFLGAGQ